MLAMLVSNRQVCRDPTHHWRTTRLEVMFCSNKQNTMETSRKSVSCEVYTLALAASEIILHLESYPLHVGRTSTLNMKVDAVLAYTEEFR
jgi:hypothetical protein